MAKPIANPMNAPDSVRSNCDMAISVIVGDPPDTATAGKLRNAKSAPASVPIMSQALRFFMPAILP